MHIHAHCPWTRVRPSCSFVASLTPCLVCLQLRRIVRPRSGFLLHRPRCPGGSGIENVSAFDAQGVSGSSSSVRPRRSVRPVHVLCADTFCASQARSVRPRPPCPRVQCFNVEALKRSMFQHFNAEALEPKIREKASTNL